MVEDNADTAELPTEERVEERNAVEVASTDEEALARIARVRPAA